ncbi:MAG: ATP synthase subunit C [Candidatus Altiarchaeota archaeon]|nr:ATP synthase subunit C [Candidatus Altiarchaeota archaeon]
MDMLFEITKEFAAATVMSLSAIGAAYAIAVTGSAAAGATAEKPEVFGKVMIFVALAEAIAIYGLIIAILILVGI